ncbi:hypothetical protein ASPSYDRAFT_447890 [Aspergillus sydowii CBS 593.65]|uniref:Uncharacterized protein n=1 Tax=Aspergillus sydowii CBS 593.65 TaxID=1036612 RepID=A0A1L9T6R1_9EURO|nr:uncharacterized protein ASPSYDRAFT_447890 [Aspergillus sydowii CBS 593.65]OJJ55132.1 hypothetical protein ASPSYDRAFT_447890 [Aspergillus sydowii CBS 593.65]
MASVSTHPDIVSLFWGIISGRPGGRSFAWFLAREPRGNKASGHTANNLGNHVYCRIGYDVGGLGTITSPPPADGGRCAWGECGVWRETHPRHTGAWRLERNNNGSELVDIQHRLYSPTGHHPLHRSESLAQPPPTGPCSTVWPPWSDLAFFLVETLGVGIS